MSSALFRCDGGDGIGEGHLSRTLPLAQELAAAGFACALATATPDAPTVAAWRAGGFPVHRIDAAAGSGADIAATTAAGAAGSRGWIVLDGYRFGAAFAERLGDTARIAFFEDTGAVDPGIDILINQNAGADVLFVNAYRKPTRTLLGPRFANIRRSLREAVRDDRGGVLVSLGGSADPALSLDVAAAVARAGEVEVTVVAAAPPAPRRDGVRVVPPQDLAPLMAQARLAVTGGGVTALEAAFLGVPAVVLVLAENQRPGAVALQQAGCCAIAADTGEAGAIASGLLRDRPRLERMSAAGRFLVDGLGSRRIAEAMASFEGRRLG